MQWCLGNFDKAFLQFINKQGLITQVQIRHLSLAHTFTKKSYVEIFMQTQHLSSKELIKLLYEGGYNLLNELASIKILDYSKMQEYINYQYFLYIDQDGKKLVAINNIAKLGNLGHLDQSLPVILVDDKSFYSQLESNFRHLNMIKAKYLIDFIAPESTAKNVRFAKVLISFCVMFCAILFNLTYAFHICNNLCYFVQSCLKIVLFTISLIVPIERKTKNNLRTPDALKFQGLSIEELPIYTIFIPLYKEPEKLESIIEAVSNLNYPTEKLDVKLVIEEDDKEMVEQLTKLSIPSYIQIITVPCSFPKTKPKALNYAMTYATGEYAVIYDAEDRPDPDQLLIAVQTFKTLPKEYVCLQAKLNFYNADENLLTKFFSIEYSVWFDYLLRGLSALDLPVPLGGTSNHFKVNILRSIGMWDAYNVTEDADLGIRLYMEGYKVHIIDSVTLEESPIDISIWLGQRSRWIKGFIQTFCVFLNQKLSHSKMQFDQVVSIYIFVGLSSYSFCCLPWLLFAVLTNSSPLIKYLWLANAIFASCYIYSSAFYIILKVRGSIMKLTWLDLAAIALFPCYFILHSIASYRAIWEAITNPFKWNKTRHGVSNAKPQMQKYIPKTK